MNTARLHVLRLPDWTPPKNQSAGNKGNLQEPKAGAVAPHSARLTGAEDAASRVQISRGHSLQIGGRPQPGRAKSLASTFLCFAVL